MKLDRKSIAFRLKSMIILIIVVQVILLSFFLTLGGVIKQARQNAFTSFSDKVKNRKNYLQREMKYHWINMEPYFDQISAEYDKKDTSEQYLHDISHTLISMLRETQTTGAFVILESSSKDKEVLYIRDSDPILNDYDNRDLYLLYGRSGLANELQIPLDQMWKSKIDLSTMSSDFYEKPLSKISLSSEARLLGYWSRPFYLTPEDISIITYSMPLLDKEGGVIGVIGVEISQQYFSKFLPSTDLQAKDSYGYMLGYQQSGEKEIQLIMFTKEIQKRFASLGDTLDCTLVDSANSVYIMKHQDMKGKIYCIIENMGLYSNNTPFEQSSWYLIGIMDENHLLSYVNKIKSILCISMISSIIIGVIFGYIVSYKFSKPIIEVAKKVKETNTDGMIKLEETGLTEVDELTKTIQIVNDMLLESAGKVSRIIEMVGIPLGVFEYSDNRETVFITDQLPNLLSISMADMNRIIKSRELFINMIQNMLSHPEEDEEDIYYTGQDPEKWLKIKYTEKDSLTIGVIIDVTDDMTEKKKIMNDRDIDPLTGIYNRKAMQFYMEDTLSRRQVSLNAAIIMFDLDNLKMINDTYGHKWGDLYIIHAVKHLSMVSDNRQILGRRSGDEFTLLLYDYETKELLQMCIDRFYQVLNKDVLVFPDGKAKAVTISAGLIWIENEEVAFDDYLQKADELLYEAKRNRKGYYCTGVLT